MTADAQMTTVNQNSNTNRPNNRAVNELRPVTIETGVSKHAEGSVMIKCGDTHVLCTASVEDRIPHWLRGSKQGWVTAQYGMLPRSTGSRMRREARQGKQGGRTLEIQRLIGRSLRSVMDLNALPEVTITLDCDVIQADGGTRTASITGAFVALTMAIGHLDDMGALDGDPIQSSVAAVSCGIVDGQSVLDLEYVEDSNAQVDANFVMDGQGRIIEIQATAEADPFTRPQMDELTDLATGGIQTLIEIQNNALKDMS